MAFAGMVSRCPLRVLLCFTFLWDFIHGGVAAQSISMEKALKRYLFHEEFDPSCRPVVQDNDTVIVYLDLAIHQIVDLNEKLQVLQAQLWITMKWHDPRMIWNPADFANISALPVPSSKLWKPDILIYNDVGFDMGRDPAQFLVRVSSDGTVLWPFSRTIESSCKLNVADFPFDRQECYFRFGSWAFTADELDIINAHDSGDVGSYVDNGEWNLLGMRVERDFATYRCCPGSYPFVTFTLVLERRYLYYVYNLISPCMIITLLGLTSFFLPAESGEKISLNVTILLGLTVFLLLVAEIMPPQSEVIPVIGKFLGLCIFVTSLSTTMSVVVLNLYFCGAREKSVPPWVRKWILGKLGYLLCARKVPQGCEQFHETPKAELIFVRGPENNLVSDRTPSPPTLSQRQRKLPVDDLGLHHEVLPDKQQEGTDLIKDWRLVSLIVDRLFFICISLADFAAFFYIVLPLLVRRPP